MRIITFIICYLLVWNYSVGQNILIREKVEKTYLSQVGVREATGHNDGVMVETYLASVNFGKGYAWCAAFVSWVYSQNAVPNPKNAWVPSWFNKNIIWARDGLKNQPPLPGDVFGLYYPSTKLIGHIGFIHRFGEKITITVEGNTNSEGSNEGDGVYMKRRPTRQLYKVARYIKD
jgi:hypothetical protein